jgi:type III restriction enzyme
VQLRNGLAPSSVLASGDFTVEMETGTGKTYVYLRTIFELNKRYGFTKFVIVVPSVAIKEGVYKSLQITEEHFKGIYAGVPVDFFLYDSSKLGQVRNFATSATIQVMVVTVGAINKKEVNNLYKDSEKTGGEKPIDLIKATRPIVIVDEPQSVDGGLTGAGKAALDAMNPLCTLRYSATHANKHHMVYRLDAWTPTSASWSSRSRWQRPPSRTPSTSPTCGCWRSATSAGHQAKVELHVKTATGVKPQELTVSDGDDLQQLAKRAVYADFRVGEINTAKGEEFLELRYPGGEVYLALGQAHGDVDALAVQREMIRRTIREHLEKEKLLRPKGIKVLSLFFIDAVERYRQYDKDGNPVKGDYARIFEEEYRRAAKLPAFQSLFGEVDLARKPPRTCTTATSPSTRRAAGPTRAGEQRLERTADRRRARPTTSS